MKKVRDCGVEELVECRDAGVSQRLRTWRALTLDPFYPPAIATVVKGGILPVTSALWRGARLAILEYAAESAPEPARYTLVELRRDEQYPLIGTPTYGSDGNEFYDDTANYYKFLETIVPFAGSLERAFYGVITLLGWSSRALLHRDLGEYRDSPEIFNPERFTMTPFAEQWLDSPDVAGRSLEMEMMNRLFAGDTALVYGWSRLDAFLCREGEFRKIRDRPESPASKLAVARLLKRSTECSLIPLADFRR